MATNYSDLLFDPNTRNFIIENNSLTLIKDNDVSLQQRLYIRFAVWKSEWKFDLSFGFPYWDYVGKKVSKEIVDAKVRSTALAPEDVLRIENFTSTFEGRYYQAYLTVVTVELEEVNLAFFGQQFEYPSPEDISNDLCPALQTAEYGARLYQVINFGLRV